MVTLLIGTLFGLAALVVSQPLTESARIAAVVAGLIPNGLFFMTTIAYGMGAVRMAGQGALIQHANAVESMSNVNVLCLDKTGR
jgi:cation-transporting ATPase E